MEFSCRQHCSLFAGFLFLFCTSLHLCTSHWFRFLGLSLYLGFFFSHFHCLLGAPHCSCWVSLSGSWVSCFTALTWDAGCTARGLPSPACTATILFLHFRFSLGSHSFPALSLEDSLHLLAFWMHSAPHSFLSGSWAHLLHSRHIDKLSPAAPALWRLCTLGFI